MIDYIKNLILGKENSEGQSMIVEDEKRLQIATCALFLELAHSDDEFTVEEEEFIKSTMKEKFNLDDETVAELIDLSIQQTKHSVSLYEFTEIINEHFNNHSKYEILKNLWRLVFADGKLDAYEEHFMRKISGNLKMEHSDMIASKMEVKAE
ncbi:MAG: TerB family tellurite resistance protein, partial [Bacteroidota bacterium]